MRLLEDLGRPTGIDLERLLLVGSVLRGWLGHPLPSRLAEVELRRQRPVP